MEAQVQTPAPPQPVTRRGGSGEHGKILNIQAGRAVAALLVVFYHADRYYFGNPVYWTTPFLRHFFAFGHSGVDFFFVLSGLIIYMVHRGDVGRPAALRPFLIKRLMRIYPLYWMCLLAAIGLFFVAPTIGDARNREIGKIVGSIFLVGIHPTDAIIFVSWTLFHEILFYAIFTTIILNRWLGWLAFLVWMAVCAGMLFTTSDPPYVFQPINLLFGIGIATARILHRGVPLPMLLTGVGIILFLATGVDEVYFHHIGLNALPLCYGLFSAAGLLGLIELEKQGAVSAPRILVLCGEASYAIYLTHMLALAVGAKILRDLGATHWAPPALCFLLLVCGGTMVGLVVHLLVEKPLLRASRRWARLS